MTGAERARVRMYLGWPARFHQTDSRLEQAMDALASTTDDETLVLAELTKLADIDVQISNTNTTVKATALGAIQLRAAYQLGVLRARGRQSVGRIAAILGVPVRADAYSGGGPVGFAGPSGPEE